MKRGLLVLQIALLIVAGALAFDAGSVKADANKVLVEKRYWKESDDKETYTFGPGDTVIASISVSTIDDVSNDVVLIDTLPNNAVPPLPSDNIRDRAKCHVPLVQPINFELSSQELRWDGVVATQAPKYFCYRFRVDTNIEAKNYAEQVPVRVEDQGLGITIGSENNYLMIVGAPWGNSMGTPPVVETPGVNGVIPSIDTAIEDKLLKQSVLLKNKSDINQGKFPNFFYKTASGKSSRGGYFNSYPVKMTDKNGTKIYGEESFYLLYNPLYYLFGNVFSGGSSTTRAFDFNSRGSTIARSDGNTKKLNSEATLYNYDFDPESLIYWDRTNLDKNAQMYENIKKYISDPKPEIVCDFASLGLTKSVLASGNFSLGDTRCNPRGSVSANSLFPNGRVWYYRASQDDSTISLDATFRNKGTLIIDFQDYQVGDVPVVSIKKNSRDDSYLGLIVINGGNVVLDRNLEKFNGIIFVPGRL